MTGPTEPAGVERPLSPAQRWLTWVFATSLGFGFSPFAPGTAGTLPIAALMAFWQPERGWLLLLCAGVVFLAGVPLSSWAERCWRKKDPGHVTIDEVAGYLVSVAFVPAHNELLLIVAAFLVFRFYDIVKPPPGRKLEFLPHGWGVMADDIVAGLYSNITLQIVFRTFEI